MKSTFEIKEAISFELLITSIKNKEINP